MNPTPIWLRAVAVLSIVVIIVWGLSRIAGAIYQAGATAERSAWQKRENAELVKANARVIELESQARAQEHRHADDLALASQTYQEKLAHEKAAHDRTVADLRSGALRLRIELARRQTGSGSATAEAVSSAGRCDGETRAELSAASAEFLVGLASEADEVVHQLTACQAVVTADRQIQSQGEK
jgi:hypothetical protein